MTTCHHGNLAVYQGRLWVTHTGCLPGARHVAGLPACLSWDLLPRHRLGTVLPRLNAASAPHYRGAMLAQRSEWAQPSELPQLFPLSVLSLFVSSGSTE